MKRIILVFYCSIIFFSCYDVEKRIIDKRKNVNLSIERRGANYANSYDTIRVKLNFPFLPDTAIRNINFKLSDGVFFENGKSEISSSKFTFDSTGALYFFADAKTSLTAGRHTITAEIPGKLNTFMYVNYLKSFPNILIVDKDRFAVERSFKDEIKLIARLRAEKGLPSKGTSVEFVVGDSLSSTSSKLFRSLTSTDDTGQATVLFTPGTFSGYTGTVNYKAITKNSRGADVIGSGSFQVVEPLD